MSAYDGDIKLRASLTTQDAQKSLKSLRSTVASAFTGASVDNLDNGLLRVNRTAKETQKEFAKVRDEISKTEAKLSELQTKQSVLLEKGTQSATRQTPKQYDNIFLSEKDYAAVKLLDTQLANTGAKLDGLHAKSAMLRKELATTQLNPAVPSGMDKTKKSASDAAKKTKTLKTNLKNVGTQGKKSTSVVTQGIQGVTASVNRLLRTVQQMLLFTVISAALRPMTEIVTAVTKSNSELNSSLQQIKSNLWTAFGAIYTKVMPALNYLMSGLAKVTAYIAAFFSALTGNSITQSYNKANELYKQANASKLQEQQKDGIDKQISSIQEKIDALEKENKVIEENEKKQKEANKKSLLSFDELNQISTPESENEQVAANEKIIDQLNEQLESLEKQKSALEDSINASDDLAESLAFPSMADTISAEITKIIQNLVLVIEGALLIIGVILLFTSNVPLGLGVIIASLLAMKYTMQSFEWSDPGVAEAVTKLWGVLISAELVIGAILVFSNANVPLGIGIIVAALAQGYAMYKVSWDSVSQNVQNVISVLGVVTGVVLIAIGIVMICSGTAIGQGIFLLLTGLAIETAAIAINWDEVSERVKGVLENISAYVGMALIAIGVILICTGGLGIAAGIALIIAGLALEAAAIVNWDEVPEKVKNVITTIMELVSTALIVIGVILICTGVGIMAGIALIIAGLALETASAIVNWDETKDNVTNVINALVDLVGKSLIAIGVILICTGMGIAAGIVLIIAGLALEATTMINWNEVPDKVKESIASVSAIVGMALFEIGVVLLFMGQIGIGLALTVAGVVGMFAAIAAAPEGLRQAIQEEIAFYLKLIGGALLVVGAILCFTGVATGVGLALLAAGGLSLIGGFAVGNMNTSAMSDIMQTSLDESNKVVTKGFNQMGTTAQSAMDDINETVTDGVAEAKETLESLNGYEVSATANLHQNITQSVSTQYATSSVPQLASGAVIPPNRKFLAVLGDQKHGTNVEAPLDTIKQAVAEVLGQSGTGNSIGDININFTGNLSQLARVLKPQISRESTRAGSSLIIGGNKA